MFGWADRAGQSLIEVALALPVLLILLLGIADGARAYYYAGVVANSAREGANYAARHETATVAQVTQRACDATGMAAFGSSCPGLTVTCESSNGDATVHVTYSFSLITASVAEAAFKINPIAIRADARFPVMTTGIPCAS
jgi:Flp pilus assembly protein TadG